MDKENKTVELNDEKLEQVSGGIPIIVVGGAEPVSNGPDGETRIRIRTEYGTAE